MNFNTILTYYSVILGIRLPGGGGWGSGSAHREEGGRRLPGLLKKGEVLLYYSKIQTNLGQFLARVMVYVMLLGFLCGCRLTN